MIKLIIFYPKIRDNIIGRFLGWRKLMIILGLSIRLSINDWRINNKKYIEFYLYLSLFYKYYFIDELNNRIYKKNEKSNVKLCYYGMVSKYKAKFMLIYANLC